MIRLEERELEEHVIATGHHIAVPFEMNHIAGAGLDLLVYSFCEAIAREFEERFADDPTGEDAQAFLDLGADRLGTSALVGLAKKETI